MTEEKEIFVSEASAALVQFAHVKLGKDSAYVNALEERACPLRRRVLENVDTVAAHIQQITAPHRTYCANIKSNYIYDSIEELYDEICEVYHCILDDKSDLTDLALATLVYHCNENADFEEIDDDSLCVSKTYADVTIELIVNR